MKKAIIPTILCAAIIAVLIAIPKTAYSEVEENEFVEVEDHQTDEVEAPQEEVVQEEPVYEEAAYEEPAYYAPVYNKPAGDAGASFMRDGVIIEDDTRYSWYSSNATRHYQTNEWSADSDGVYRDSDGYVVVASQDAKGTVVDTPFGEAKVYDYCETPGTVDIYTNY